MQTQNGIELNLKESNYKYEFKGFIFYFSSKLYKEKFIKKLPEFIMLESLKIKNKYKLRIDFSLFLGVSLYKKIEKRGFRVENKTGISLEETSIFNTNV